MRFYTRFTLKMECLRMKSHLFSMALLAAFSCTAALAQTPLGELKGQATAHTPESSQAVVAKGALVLPASVTSGAIFVGEMKDAPSQTRGKAPLVVFMHGSSGLALKAIGEWQLWLAGMGIASFAPDSFALPDRLTYKSPVAKDVYEKIHALRGSEIDLAVQAVKAAPWADSTRLVLAGTSEGATAVARYNAANDSFAGRVIFSWSCEDNYFVQTHKTALPADRPVLNVMSANDTFFSPSNPWLGSQSAKGHCGGELKNNKQATVVLIPGAPHTLMNLPAARHATAGFLKDLFKL
jgi:dienelactone hydrolase